MKKRSGGRGNGARTSQPLLGRYEVEKVLANLELPLDSAFQAVVEARNLKYTDAAAGSKLRIEHVAVVVRREIGMPLGEKNPRGGREVRIAEHQLPLRHSRIKVQRVTVGCVGRNVGKRRVTFAEVRELAPFE